MGFRYTVYGRSGCRFCDKAVDLLEREGLPYSYVPLDVHREKLKWFKEELKLATVPQIFLGSLHIGGYSDLEKFLTKEG